MPNFHGAPEKSRTPNLQIRSLALYPIELRALLSFPCFFYLVELLNKFEYHMSTTNINLILTQVKTFIEEKAYNSTL